MELDHLSYSSISSFLACPENWRRRYIAKEPSKCTPALVFGTAIHNTIEEHVIGKGDLLQLWPGFWHSAIEGQKVYWDLDSPETYFNDGIRILSDHNITRGIGEIRMPSDVEKKVELRVPGVPIPIIGYIDVITKDGVPGDFKTSARSWDRKRAQNELQPLFYLAALNQAGIRVPDWKFRHYTVVKTKQPKWEVFEVCHSAGEIFFLMETIQKVWQAIESNIFPLNPTSWKCNPEYCDFWKQCRGRYT